ncbi:phosphoadenylyl-sulfate reductase [Streptomyces calidiresistens]|uniref:Adenosine 5'-phosphosulfate reductase n=1 Tax=Streptomyces calidiresistens TaxID=1485586 RepID=A0A7W3T3L7_9ACTN|nr:phosphoadenylyl-sulfate reductase [Streptomyces calidiresistens]MBB0230339.1 phosphoadenylyl-sulfate reductase [Streptomyces calidiresistens]
MEEAPASAILRWAVETFGPRFCVTSSMEDAVVAHLASRVAPGVDVVFLDTGYHFPETIGTRDAVAAVMDVNVITLTPRRTVAEQDAEHGPRLHDRDPDLCCALRKVEPLERGLGGYDAWATGLRRDESPTRANTPVVGWDERRRKVKVSPIARWTQDDVDAYVAEHGVLTNPLLQDGYASIGCAPCTRRVAAGEDARAGRWAGRGKTECGLHG